MGSANHDVHATITIEQVASAVTNDHVVTRWNKVHTKEGRKVTGQGVVTDSTFKPVCVFIAVNHVSVGSAVHKVVAWSTQLCGAIATTHGEVRSCTCNVTVEPRSSSVNKVAAIARHHNVNARRVGQRVITQTTDDAVIAWPTGRCVISVVATNRVVT
ncbi:unannotated protein [freshwater metagenome]|uniref:Unannotated protein n=1 Tax=freshwater metagenome TaxID=449393 RepID=A0A6J6HU35_9ZZZZ